MVRIKRGAHGVYSAEVADIWLLPRKDGKMKLFIMVAILCLASQAAASGKRPTVLISGTRYFVEEDDYGATRDEASLYCQQAGGILAVITSGRAFNRLKIFLLQRHSMEMVLTGLEYDHAVNPAKPLLPNGEVIPYKPQWFEGHPIRQDLHGEIAYIPNRSRKFSGFMNIADGARYKFFLCSKSTK